MIEVNDIGKELIRRGWIQGSLLKIASASKMYLAAEKPDWEDMNTFNINPPVLKWNVWQEPLDESDLLVIVSQSCDIQKSPYHEPFIEVMRACWTDDRAIIHEASRNSVRYFLLQRYHPQNEPERALVADATIHLLLEKISFLYLTPLTDLHINDRVVLRLFRRWLGRRYDRLALEDDLVNAIQKPVVKAIGRLRSTHPLHDVLDGIGEVLLLLQNNAPPYKIVLLFLRDERSDASSVSLEQAAQLVGWMDNVLQTNGNATLVDWRLLDTEDISLKVYTNALKLSLDQYSLHLDDLNNE